MSNRSSLLKDEDPHAATWTWFFC